MAGGKFFKKQTLQTVPVEGKTVLVRVDFNVPLTEDGTIDNDFRIRAAVPTIQWLIEQHCKIVLISHLGRPKGEPDPQYSLEVTATRLAELLGQSVQFIDDCVGDKVKVACKKLTAGQVVLLENLRFYPGEKANDAEFAKQLARDSGAQYFVQDGFGVVHRAHASTDAITLCLPSVAGLLLEKEVTSIKKAVNHPERPLVVVSGGAKISDKIPLIEKFIAQADSLVIGGAMANTFLQYKGYNMQASKTEEDQAGNLDHLYKKAQQKAGDNVDSLVLLPTDVAVATEPGDGDRVCKSVDELGDGDMALDIGDASIVRMLEVIRGAKTVIWNGPLGMTTYDRFAHGSARLALELATGDHMSIIGGGDTAEFVLEWDARGGESFSLVSTGGGASLQLMAGDTLPGVEALLDA